ncbi:hypothetical protein ACH0AK_00110 [Enterococcus pernyi]
MKENQDIRIKIFTNGFRNWEVAAKMGVSDSRLCVLLRTPLNDKNKARIEKAIDELVAERKRG